METATMRLPLSGAFAKPVTAPLVSHNALNSLTVVDNRTGMAYDVPINDQHNYVHAMDFKKIRAPEDKENPAAQKGNGLRLFDPGFQNTACMHSEITYVDGQHGNISYRGYPVADLFRSRPFEHVAFLLIYGHLPSDQEAADWNKTVATSPMPPKCIFDNIRNLPKNIHPSTVIGGLLATYAATCPDKIPAFRGRNLYKGNLALIDREIPQVLFAHSVIAAAVFCHLHDREFAPPKPDYGYLENILHMMRFVDEKTGKPDPQVMRLLSRMLILTADHEICSSTAAALHAASTLADPFSCAVTSQMAGMGPLHVGSIEMAYKQLEAVGDLSNIPQLIEDVKQQKRRLFGYGHRMYKVTDPRSYLIREVIAEAGDAIKNDKILAIANEIDHVASQDEYFTSRRLCLNPDLFLSFTYKAVGIPTNFITPMVVMGRNPGIMAHWREAMADRQPRMWRPLGIYTGKVPRTEQTEDDVTE